eukprot:3678072-Prymnesium_polylepis.1
MLGVGATVPYRTVPDLYRRAHKSLKRFMRFTTVFSHFGARDSFPHTYGLRFSDLPVGKPLHGHHRRRPCASVTHTLKSRLSNEKLQRNS